MFNFFSLKRHLTNWVSSAFEFLPFCSICILSGFWWEITCDTGYVLLMLNSGICHGVVKGGLKTSPTDYQTVTKPCSDLAVPLFPRSLFRRFHFPTGKKLFFGTKWLYKSMTWCKGQVTSPQRSGLHGISATQSRRLGCGILPTACAVLLRYACL